MVSEDRAQAFLDELSADSARSQKLARRLESRVGFCWWSSMVCTGLAALGGFLAAIPEVKSVLPIQPWWISLLAIVATGFDAARRRSNWRAKSNVFYGRERDVDRIIAQLRHEIAHPSDNDIAKLSREFQAAKDRFGGRMNDINALEDAKES